jgi:ABC-2 type transport system permease protein
MKYSQIRAMLAISRASFRAITRNPSAVIFSFIFPFIFILVFGFIGQKGPMNSFRVSFTPDTDTTNEIYRAILNSSGIKRIDYADTSQRSADLRKGRLVALLSIHANPTDTVCPWKITSRTTSASNDKWPLLNMQINRVIQEISDARYPNRPALARFDFNTAQDVEQVREYKTIDFILPGQLGFSLLSAGVFGVAFLFFNLRNTMVLKRFFATPIHRGYIILGEGLSRIVFQLITAVVIIVVGRYAFGFTLIHGFLTFWNMMVLSFIGLVVFMGFGFIISGLAKADNTIPPFANLVTLPQFLLGGTFFSIDNFPSWLQPISKAMPLTHLNEAFRQIAFEGQSLWDVRAEVSILLLWGIVAYAIAIRTFRWE